MKRILSVLSFLCCLLFVLPAFAGRDPISWSQNPSTGFPANVSVGSTYQVTYTLTNNLSFSVPLRIESSFTGGAFYLTNHCNTTLAPGASCVMYLTLQPLGSTTHRAKLTMAYHKNRVPIIGVASSGSSPETVDRITGHVTTPLPAVTYTGTSYPVGFTFANNGTGTVTATAVTVTGFTATGNTCTTALIPSATCAVTGTFSPVTDGKATLGVTYTYTSGTSKSVPLTTQTDVTTSSGACHHVDGYAALPLPITTYTNASNTVKFVFTNHCDASTETLGTVSVVSDGTATVTKGTGANDTCSGATLAANASCFVLASVIPTAATTDLSVTATVPYDTATKHASATTSESVIAPSNASSVHTLMFVNQCDQNVWYAFQNNAGGTKSPDPTPAAHRSFLDYQLNQQLTGAAPDTLVLDNISVYQNGAIYGRTGCNMTTGSCLTANCPVIAGTGTCQTGVAPNNPATIFEANLLPPGKQDGVYDLSIINGFNLPGEVRSLAAVGADPTQQTLFGCGQSAGAVIQPAASSELANCPWSFTPPQTTSPDSTANYYWVSGGADDGCTPATACGANNYCGTAYSSDVPGTAPYNRRCGTFLGYWTIADYIGLSSSSQWGSVDLYTQYNLGTLLPPHSVALTTGGSVQYGYGGATYGSMYGCTHTDSNNGSLLSGYNNTNPLLVNSCGCYDWNASSSQVKTAQHANQSCLTSANSTNKWVSNQNTDWQNTVFDRIVWLKTACPTAYSYQFDDSSTQFQCNVKGTQTSYQITFCPGGKTGRPGT